MSAPLRHVKSARKDQGECSNCSAPLPIGSEYRYYRPGFRSKTKIRVCMKPECTPAASQLDQSKMSSALAAQEAALAAIDGAETIEDIETAIEEASGAAGEVRDEYEEALQSTPMLEEQVQPMIDALDEWINELDGVSLDPIDSEEARSDAHGQEAEELGDGHDCDACKQNRDAQLDERKEEAREAVNALEYA